MQDVLERFAFDNIYKLAFNVDPGCLGGGGTSSSEFMQAFADAATLNSGRFLYAFPAFYYFKKFFNIGSRKGFRNQLLWSMNLLIRSENQDLKRKLREKAEICCQDLLGILKIQLNFSGIL